MPDDDRIERLEREIAELRKTQARDKSKKDETRQWVSVVVALAVIIAVVGGILWADSRPEEASQTQTPGFIEIREDLYLACVTNGGTWDAAFNRCTRSTVAP